jgi:DNA-binding PadR family transcriptional regulator
MHHEPLALREPTFHILLALARGELHGYGIITRIGELTDGSVKVGAGTLYGALDRLGADGLVVATRTEVVAGRDRRYYRLTESGAATLTAEVERRAAQAEVARAEVAGLAPGGATS